MKEIKFRAIDEFSDQWIYGQAFFIDSDNKQGYIANGISDHHCVKKETVGQYIGLEDKNGKEIFENDIVRWLDDFPICKNCINEDSEKLDVTTKYCPDCGTKIKRQDYYIKGVVVFGHSRWNFRHEYDDGISEAMRKTTEVIGNKFENPELSEEI